jgi:hypothetical protein
MSVRDALLARWSSRSPEDSVMEVVAAGRGWSSPGTRWAVVLLGECRAGVGADHRMV